MTSLSPQEISHLIARGLIRSAMQSGEDPKRVRHRLQMREYRRNRVEHYRELNRKHQAAWRARHRKAA